MRETLKDVAQLPIAIDVGKPPNDTPKHDSKFSAALGRNIALAGFAIGGAIWAALATQVSGGVQTRVAVMIAAGLGAYGLVAYLLAQRSLRDVRATLQRQQSAAMHDALTGLPSRDLFDDRIGQAIGVARRSGKSAAVVVIDVNRFKETNDAVGNRAGDRVLREIATRLGSRLRQTDTVARIGGDDFGVVLSDVAGEGAAVRVVEDLRRILNTPVNVDGVPVIVEVTAGIAMTGEMDYPPATYVQRAERAHRRAKRTPGGVAVHDPAIDDDVKDQLALINELRAAIARGELRLFYQPKPRLRTGRVRSVEALIRWEHPTRGLLAPGHFMPLAERTGLMRPLTLWVLDEAMRQSREWLDAGRKIKIAVNLSQQSLLDGAIHDEIARVLERHAMPAKALEIEITESALVSDLKAAQAALERLAGQGISLSIDDYGTGHSSLAHVKQLPVGCIKIDRAFIDHMDSDPANAAIVRSTVELARDLGMKLVAEGIERQEEWDALRELGCDFAQGFLISRPVPADEFVRWLDERDGHYSGPLGALPAFG